MKIYFSATITDNATLRASYRNTIDYLKEAGYEVFDYESDKILPSDIQNRSHENTAAVFKRLNKYLSKCDIYISDISQSSVGIGYEIAQILMMKKPAIVLKYEKADFEPLATLYGNDSSFLKFVTYNDHNKTKILDLFLKEAKDKIPTKFNLFLTPELDNYLEWIAKNKGKAKSEFTPETLKKILEKGEEYKDSLRNLDK